MRQIENAFKRGYTVRHIYSMPGSCWDLHDIYEIQSNEMCWLTFHIVKSPSSSDSTTVFLLMRVFFFDDPACFPLFRLPLLVSSDSTTSALVGLAEARDLIIDALVTESSGRSWSWRNTSWYVLEPFGLSWLPDWKFPLLPMSHLNILPKQI